jgi:hypothetical protein
VEANTSESSVEVIKNAELAVGDDGQVNKTITV